MPRKAVAAKAAKPKAAAVAVERALSPAERPFVQAWAKRALSVGPRKPVKFRASPTNYGIGDPDTTVPLTVIAAQLAELSCSPHQESGYRVLEELIRIAANGGAGSSPQRMHLVQAMLLDFAPTDPLEVALCTQMIATHTAALEMLSRASIANPDALESLTAQSGRLLQVFATQYEVLTRHRARAKGPRKVTEQRITVVHVNDGGQAIVGDVAHGSAPGPDGGE